VAKTERLESYATCSRDSGTKSLSNGRKPTKVSVEPHPALRTHSVVGGAFVTAPACSVGCADLWHEGSALGGVLQTFGQQHFVLCNGQDGSFAAAFQLALSKRPESVAVELNATNTKTPAMILKRRCIARMLSPEAKGSKRFLLSSAGFRSRRYPASLLRSCLRNTTGELGGRLPSHGLIA
jgi:hypothetical protein